MAPIRNTQNYLLAKIIDVRIARNPDGDDLLLLSSLPTQPNLNQESEGLKAEGEVAANCSGANSKAAAEEEGRKETTSGAEEEGGEDAEMKEEDE